MLARAPETNTLLCFCQKEGCQKNASFKSSASCDSKRQCCSPRSSTRHPARNSEQLQHAIMIMIIMLSVTLPPPRIPNSHSILLTKIVNNVTTAIMVSATLLVAATIHFQFEMNSIVRFGNQPMMEAVHRIGSRRIVLWWVRETRLASGIFSFAC